ncbi:MAG: nuclear transport factor 2 family protein [Solirubrobacteraceae bacterium]
MSLNDQLQQLSDRQAVTELITRLGMMLDEKRFDEAGTILADDVTVQTPGGSSRGPRAVVAQARRNHTVRTQHVITDVLVQLDGDRAEARANLIVTFVPNSDRPGAGLIIGDSEQPESRLMIGERYRFGAARREPGWRLTRIEVARLWSTNPLAAGARVVETNRDVTAAAS